MAYLDGVYVHSSKTPDINLPHRTMENLAKLSERTVQT
jgi:hypothetical protein